MKLLDRYVSDRTPQYYYYIFGFITAFFILFYIYYSFTAWFMQDDIGFLLEYPENLLGYNLFSFNSVHRFLSINMYWHFLHKFFGNTAAPYFMINLLILCSNSIILFFLLRGLSKDTIIAMAGVFIYFIMPSTIKNMTWICNNQHLMSHFFAFLFCHIYFNKGCIDNLDVKRGIALSVLLVCTLISNFLAAFFIPCIVIYHILHFNEIKLKKINVIFMIFWGFLFIVFVIIASTSDTVLKTAEYGINLSFGIFLKTLQSYSFHIYKSVPILVISIIIILAVGIVKKDKLVIFFIMSSICFYIPFAFAIFQRNVNYLAISYMLYCVSIVIILKKHVRVPVLLLLFMLYNVFNTRTLVKEFSENPAGDRVRYFLTQMKEAYVRDELQRYGKIYFKTDGPVNYKTGIGAIDMKDTPIFWIRIANGKALKIFLDPNLVYHAVKYNEEPISGYPVVIVSKDLSRREDAGVKKVILPKE